MVTQVWNHARMQVWAQRAHTHAHAVTVIIAIAINF